MYYILYPLHKVDQFAFNYIFVDSIVDSVLKFLIDVLQNVLVHSHSMMYVGID